MAGKLLATGLEAWQKTTEEERSQQEGASSHLLQEQQRRREVEKKEFDRVLLPSSVLYVGTRGKYSVAPRRRWVF